MAQLQLSVVVAVVVFVAVSIPQAVWPSCNELLDNIETTEKLFQYRKRYGPVATGENGPTWCKMCVFQYRKRYVRVATIKDYSENIGVLFQYRKRYGPVATEAINKNSTKKDIRYLFQYRKRYVRVATRRSCLYLQGRRIWFQYRKRYVRVATMRDHSSTLAQLRCFNTASGMYALQQRVWKPAPRQG